MINVDDFFVAFASVFVFTLIIVIAWVVFYLIGLFKLFKKCRQEGWKAIVPFYNRFILTTDIAGLEWYWFLLWIAPTLISFTIDNSMFSGIADAVALLASINIYYNLSKKFNKSNGWIILSVFFGWITIPLLGYSNKETFNETVLVSKDGLFDRNKATTSNQNMNSANNYSNQVPEQSMPFEPGQPMGNPTQSSTNENNDKK